ncbi:MAG: glycosyltransferase family 10 [Candidatus Nitrotoga sp.]|nr:glycosyltransferase family 10 [Candidatus Nitrotoga sp.]MDO9447150.1 glycosyltransferase family 10 [Candidatus Nitrotoga sp.]MDP3496956.1 glycosyltransferase family 10 [Candidatus Nitrotoga sp.]
MKHASIVVGRHKRNDIFKPGAGPNGGEFHIPYRLLRELFLEAGIELSTADMNIGREVIFELHINARRRLPKCPAYAYLYEDPIIRPLNNEMAQLRRYRKVFTSNETLIDGKQILCLDYPNDLNLRPMPSFIERDLFCVMIASNKALLHPHPHSLHNSRIEIIRFFEAQAPELFALYGKGWDIPAVRPGLTGRLIKRMNEWRARITPSRPFPSYRGTVYTKSEVLDRAKFSICYENSRGSPGYLTEKIFDCFTSGCIPIYIGSTHRTALVPEDCYIDGDRFNSSAEMLKFLQSIDAVSHARYQAAIQRFLAGPDSVRFTNVYFCQSLVNVVMADLMAV